MGKIFNALEKYRHERLLTRPVPKMRSSDWEALLKYDRGTGKLNLESSDIIKNQGTIGRLLANKMIRPDGKLTTEGRKMCEKYELRHSTSTTDNIDHPNKEVQGLQKSAESVPPPKLKESDLSALMQYDRETRNILKYDPESGQLDKSSKAILRESDLIQRLIDNGLILPGGWITTKGAQECEKKELRLKKRGPEKSKSRQSVQYGYQKTKSSETHGLIRKAPKELKPAENVLKRAEEKEGVEKQDDTSIPDVKTSIVSANKVIENKIFPAEAPAALYRDEQIDKNLVSFLEPGSFEAEQFKIMRSNIFYPISGKIPQSLAVTSAMPGEGKSFVAANLAISIANEIDRYVLLIDCDLRRPTIHSLFGYGNVPGLSDYLTNRSGLTSLLLKTKVNKLTILPAGTPPPNPSELLSSERMSAFLEEASDRYKDRLVILDSPPPTMTAEANALVRFVDGVLLVVKYGSTTRAHVEDLIKIMGREKIIGSVMNNVDMRSSRYGYRKYREQYSPASIHKGKK